MPVNIKNHKKIRKLSEDVADVHDRSDDESVEDVKVGDLIPMDFVGKQFEWIHQHAVETLLAHDTRFSMLDVRTLVRFLLQHESFGTVLEQDLDDCDSIDDDEHDDNTDDESSKVVVFGFSHLINFTLYKDIEIVAAVKLRLEQLLAASSDASVTTKTSFAAVLQQDTEAGQTAFVFNERNACIPPKIAVRMLDVLFDEIHNVAKFRIRKFILIGRIEKPSATHQNDSEIVFENVEESVFCEQSDLFFDTKIACDSQQVSTKLYHRVMVVDAAKIPAIMATVKTRFGHD